MPARHRCIQEFNPGAGLIAGHIGLCAVMNGQPTPCALPVEFHVRISYFCGNMCGKHKDKFVNRHKDAVITEPIFLGIIYLTPLSQNDATNH